MRDKADEFFKKQYYDFIQQVKTTETTEQATEYVVQLATALYAKRDEYGHDVRAERCITEAAISLRSVTEQYPQARELFTVLKDVEENKTKLVQKLQHAIHEHKKS